MEFFKKSKEIQITNELLKIFNIEMEIHELDNKIKKILKTKESIYNDVDNLYNVIKNKRAIYKISDKLLLIITFETTNDIDFLMKVKMIGFDICLSNIKK